ncbi:MAG: class I SAM-dependent methyltransferase [Actinomycetota bacterium]|nr:class I SAM-dependent methyltransferase [Actinomycetota bacterium]
MPGSIEQAAAFEWFDPDSPSAGLMDAERLARYWWAAQAVSGKEVLDVSGGAGRGARILADAGARRVTGVVVSRDAQAEAVRRAGDVADFVTGELDALPFAPASFDIAVCFDGIDGSEQRSELLDELHRVLREDGSLFLTSPSPDGLERELATRFATVALHRQHTRLACAIVAGDGLPEGEATLAVRPIPPLDPGQAPVTLVVAGKREAPALADLLALCDPFEARSWEDRVQRARRETDGALRGVEAARAGERHLAAERDLISRRLIEVEQALARSLSMGGQEGPPGDESSGWEAAILALARTASRRMNALRSAAKTLLGLRR